MLTIEDNKTALVVIDENILGYIAPYHPRTPDWYASAGILHASIPKGATVGHWASSVLLSGREVRLATEKDFADFRVLFEGYKNDPAYQYQK